jgi:hypothetical protein
MGVFVFPQIRQLFRDEQFDPIPSDKDKRVWNDFGLVATTCLGNNKDESYKKFVENLLLSHQKLGCCVSLETHFLLSHLDFFFRKNVKY